MKQWAIRTVAVWTLGLAALIWWGRWGEEPAAVPLALPVRGSSMDEASAGTVNVTMGTIAEPALLPASETAWLPDVPRPSSGTGLRTSPGAQAVPTVTLQPPRPLNRQTIEGAEADAETDPLSGAVGMEWGWLNETIADVDRAQQARRKALSEEQFGWNALTPGWEDDTLPMDRMFQSEGLAGPGFGLGSRDLFGD